MEDEEIEYISAVIEGAPRSLFVDIVCESIAKFEEDVLENYNLEKINLTKIQKRNVVSEFFKTSR